MIILSVIINNKAVDMDKGDKKKRHVSGSRSKSRKSKPNDASVDLKPHKPTHTSNSHEHSSKVKTQNSINKSKGSKKCSKQQKKAKFLKAVKNNIDQSKQISRSASAQRKHSLVKMNRTEANFEADDIERRIYALKKSISKIEKPTTIATKQIYSFYQEIQQSIEMVSEPLYSLLCSFHELYVSPIAQLLDMISPYEHLLQRKEELSREVEQQVRQNEQAYSMLTEEDIYIIKLKETIEEQRQLIDEKKKQQLRRLNEGSLKQAANQVNNEHTSTNLEARMFKNEGVVRNMRKDKPNPGIQRESSSMDKERSKEREKEKEKEMKSTMTFKDNSKEEEAERDSPPHNAQGASNKHTMIMGSKTAGLKLDLGGMNKGDSVGFHDEFYAKIDQFSESWRNQALREKRY